ncbi:MAG: hypothetical protein ACRD2W_23875 [Acidimicrobiales bacterium]
MPLEGKVAVVPVGEVAAAVARRLAAEGAIVVLVAGDAESARAGALAAEIQQGGSGRPAVFACDDADLDGLVEFLTELFRPAT